MGPRFEARGAPADGTDPRVATMAAVTAPILALSVTDDEFGTEAAIDRLLAYYTGSAALHLRLSPASMGLASIGHFAFFHERFRDTLWPIALGWLTRGQWAPLPATPYAVTARRLYPVVRDLRVKNSAPSACAASSGWRGSAAISPAAVAGAMHEADEVRMRVAREFLDLVHDAQRRAPDRFPRTPRPAPAACPACGFTSSAVARARVVAERAVEERLGLRRHAVPVDGVQNSAARRQEVAQEQFVVAVRRRRMPQVRQEMLDVVVHEQQFGRDAGGLGAAPGGFGQRGAVAVAAGLPTRMSRRLD